MSQGIADKNSILKSFLKREKLFTKEFEENKIFDVDVDDRPKIFITFPYPYMNGSLHLGHAYSSCRLDVYARYKRLNGYNVLYPWAWHWTGEAVYGTVHRIRENDESVIKRLIELDGVEPEEIDNLRDASYLVKYFTSRNRPIVKRLGLSIDWSREFHTTSLHPLYDKFIKWQIRTLYKRGFIVKGSHPLVWCPVDKSPTGDHDRLKGEGVRPEKYVLVKFKLDNKYLVAGTLRPETIFGSTNIWVNPNGRYVEAVVGDETWIISNEAYEKLVHQNFDVKKYRNIDIKTLLGSYVKVPLTDRIIPILPASFVDTDFLTGIVYSVPAHAPYDYVALKDLMEDPNLSDELKKLIKTIRPISIISVEGYGEYPAITVVKNLGISSQNDVDLLEKATKEVYNIEYHKGIMKSNAGPISNLSVKEAKELIKSILIDNNLGTIFYELPEPVICRCTSKCLVKIIPDQWFLKYSDENWKKLAHEAVNGMKLLPEELRELFHHYIDWYHDWPCTRRTGLGTAFPFDEEWIVETLTDSTIYNAFYLISKYYNMGLIDPDKIKDSFFDYIFLDIGRSDEVAKENGIEESLLERIKRDFNYWYPVDLRGSGKDLIGNHLTFFIFHHVAIFPRDKWPRGITVNGFMMLNGKPMSKSKGNYLSLERALELVGADALRVSLLSLVDGLDDPDWSVDWARSILLRLNNIENTIRRLWFEALDVDNGFFDELVIQKFRKTVKEVSSRIENMEVAAASRLIFFDFYETLRNYLLYTESPSRNVVDMVIPNYIVLLSMYAPYMAEDLWRNLLKRSGYAAHSKYPDVEDVDEGILVIDRYLEDVVDDIMKILDIIGSSDKSRIKVLVADDGLWNLFKKIFSEQDQPQIKNIMQIVRGWDLKDRRYLEKLGRFLLREWYGRYTKFRYLLNTLDREAEYRILKNYLPKYLERHGIKLDLAVEVYRPGASNKLPYPLYPAIIVE